MKCMHLVSSKCIFGHTQSWICHKGNPLSCRICEDEIRAKEKRERDDFERQQRQEQKEKEHKKKMSEIDDEIRFIREKIADDEKSKQMALALEQRLRDLKDARPLVTSFKSPQTSPMRDTEILGTSSLIAEDPSPLGEKANRCVEKSRKEQHQHAYSPSKSEREWDRQKGIEGASNDTIDALMKMTGLEEVKSQVLKIKARTDTALRQNTNMADERFGIVLLGNPGTGTILWDHL